MKKIPAQVIKPHWEPESNDLYQSKWLADVLNGLRFSCRQLGEVIGVSKQTISNWLYGKTPMTYRSVVAICYAFDLYDDPEKVWKKIEEEAACCSASGVNGKA